MAGIAETSGSCLARAVRIDDYSSISLYNGAEREHWVGKMNLRAAKPTADDVRNLYRLLLGRNATERSIATWIDRSPSLEWLVREFLTSEEFSQKNKYEKKPFDRLSKLVEELASRHPKRELYQPLFGVEYEYDGPIQRDCESRVKLVLNTLNSYNLRNMTLVDVGCNMGYISFSLAQHFNRVVGMEVDRTLYDLCEELRIRNKSQARFYRFDFFGNYENLPESFDVCLLFSVIHYLVAGKGLAAAKEILTDIVSMFDHVIIELSSSRDYPYMPHDPSSLVTDISGYTAEKIGFSEKNDRPIYHLKRSKIYTESPPLSIKAITYKRPHPKESCTRIYRCAERVVKVLPLAGYRNNLDKYENEVAAYHKLSGIIRTAELISSGKDSRMAWISTLPLGGQFLNNLITQHISDNDKETIVCKILSSVNRMQKEGLFWNDLSSHNVAVVDSDIRLFDFGETQPAELHDHVSMVCWLLNDLAVGRPESYEIGVYELIHKIGNDSSRFAHARPDPNKKLGVLQWVFDFAIESRSITAFFQNKEIVGRINAIAARPIEMKT